MPEVLRGEDLYLKSGSVALLTDNAFGTLFDKLNVIHTDCTPDPFDSEKAIEYKIITNRFHELYKIDINILWE